MSTVADVRYEFRCTHCYQSLIVSIDVAGNTVDCPSCHAAVTAPEATEDRIQRAGEVDEDACVAAEPGMFVETEQPSHKELAKLAKQRARQSTADSGGRCRSPEKMGASRFRRLLAVIVDWIVSIVSCLFAGIFFTVLVAVGLLDLSTIEIDEVKLAQDPVGLLLTFPWQILAAGIFVPAVVILIQWYLISTRGQSIGKMLLSIKIVSSTGHAPGFTQGVVLRNGSRLAWNYIPAFLTPFVAAGLLPWISAGVSIGAVANILFICLSPPRCLHDHIAGTYVVDA